jgi:hypothetical protein
VSRQGDTDARLARLAGEDEMHGGARVVARASDGRAAVLRAVAEAIDETVLPAILVLGSDGAGRVSLVVAGRRLRAVEDAAGGLELGALAGVQLDAEEVGGVDALMVLLLAFADGAQGPVTVRDERGGEGGGRGLSARRLIEMIPVSDDQPAAAASTGMRSAVDRFRELAGDALLASLTIAPSGATDHVGLADLEPVLMDFAEMEPPEEGPGLVLWLRQTGRPDGRAFGRAVWDDGTVAALAFPAGRVGRVTVAFRGSRAD